MIFAKFVNFINLGVPSRLVLQLGMFMVFYLMMTKEINSMFFLGAISLAFADLASSTLNSIYDTKIDKVNRVKRPLSLKLVSLSQAIFVMIFEMLIAFTTGLFISLGFSIIVIFRFFFEILYSALMLKRFYPINYLLSGINYGAIPLFAAYFITLNIRQEIYPAVVLLLIFSVTMAPLKDVQDFVGDKKAKINTLPVLMEGKNIVRQIIRVNFFILLLFGAYWLAQKSIFLYSTLLASLLLGILFQLTKTARINHTQESFITKSSMLVAVSISFVFAISAWWL